MIRYLDETDQVYLDSAATSQKPRVVMNAMQRYYDLHNANPRRGISHLSSQASELVERARQTVTKFINAPSRSVVYTKNTTEGLNMVVHGWANKILKAGDQIMLTEMEHHANLIPWQVVAKATGATLIFISVDDAGQIDLAQYKRLLSEKTKIVATTHVSNVFGTIMPIKQIAAAAHRVGAIVVVDGAQAVPHIPVNVQDLDADFYAFSSHKMYGPTGVGVLYGKAQLLEQTDPLLYGGSMIKHVTFDHATLDDPPHKFEGGTQDVAGALGLEAAIAFLQQFRWDDIQTHQTMLTRRLVRGLAGVVKIHAPANLQNHSSIISLSHHHIHPHDLNQVLDLNSVYVRSGHHCAEPLMTKLGLPGTTRISVGIYNNATDIDRAVDSVKQAVQKFHE